MIERFLNYLDTIDDRTTFSLVIFGFVFIVIFAVIRIYSLVYALEFLLITIAILLMIKEARRLKRIKEKRLKEINDNLIPFDYVGGWKDGCKNKSRFTK